MRKVAYESLGETVYKKTLANGLDIVLIPRQEVSKVYGFFMTNYGSINRTFTPIGETEQVTVPDGVAHFLEHKLFEKEDYDVFSNFLEQGASPNAFTSFTKTAYLFSATKQAEKNIETLLDFVQEPYFSDASVEKEKGIISQEYHMYDDQADWRSFMGSIKNMFANHPVNIDILGTIESINNITKEDLYTCYNTFYHPSNMTLCVIGNFDLAEMEKLITDNQAAKSFDDLAEINEFFPDEPVAVHKKESTIHLPVSVPKVTIGIKESNVPLDKEQMLRRETFQGMLLDYFFSTSGEYYEELYETGVIDNSFSYSTSVEKSFAYTLIGGNTAKPEEFAKKMKQLLLDTSSVNITEEEFAVMKKMRIGSVLRAMNSLEYVANKYVQYDFVGIDLFEMIPYIQSLTVADVNAFLQDWITEEKLTTCTVIAQ